VNCLFICCCIIVQSRLCIVSVASLGKLLRKALTRCIPGDGLICCVATLLYFAVGCARVCGQSPETQDAVNPQYEYNIKAAFLYSFGRYVEWPKEAFAERSGAFVIGVCGEDPFGQALDRIAQAKTIQGRRIIIQRMATIEELQPCHILFVSRLITPEQQTAIYNKLRDKWTLLVGESPGFAVRGGGINFFLEGGTVRFEINVEAIRQEKLLLDAKLLNLGKKVSESTSGQGKNSDGM
jgi:YfiR/HmsC-like